MAKLKKCLRLLVLVFLIVLAVFGIGLSGAAVVPTAKREDRNSSNKVELVEEQEAPLKRRGGKT